jgi:hypothetical protein
LCCVFADEDHLFMGERVGGIAHCGVNVVAGQAWISLEQIGLRGLLA